MFGRYSIDAEGLIYTGGDFNDKWNLGENKVRKVEKDEEGNNCNPVKNRRFVIETTVLF